MMNVRIPSLYSHAAGGEGIHYMPEVGCFVWVCVPSDSEDTAFLLLSGASIVKDASADSQPGSFDMNRPLLNPGDLALLTRDGNGLALRRGGVVELRGTPLSKIIFDPPRNRILNIAETYEVQTFGGSLDWRNLRREESGDGLMGTRFQIKAKEFAEHPGHSVRLTLGNTGEVLPLQSGDDAEKQTEEETEFKYTLSSTSKKVEGQDVVSVIPGQEITVKTKTIKAVNPSATVVDLTVFKDETVSEDKLEKSLSLGIDREGDLQLETEGAVKIDASSKWVEIVVGSSTPFTNTEAAGAKKVLITTGSQGSTEPVTRGYSLISDLALSLTEISVALKGLGIPTPSTDEFVASVIESVGAGAPYLSNTLESE